MNRSRLIFDARFNKTGDTRLELVLTEPETVVLPITPIPKIDYSLATAALLHSKDNAPYQFGNPVFSVGNEEIRRLFFIIRLTIGDS